MSHFKEHIMEMAIMELFEQQGYSLALCKCKCGIEISVCNPYFLHNIKSKFKLLQQGYARRQK